jgi:hypothetical protein
MADGGGRPAPPTGRPAAAPPQAASGDLRAQINRAYASSAPIVEDEPDTRRTTSTGPLPETAARFAAAMAAVEQQQSAQAQHERSSSAETLGGPPAGPPAGPPVEPQKAPAPRREQRPAGPAAGARRPRRARLRLTHIDPWSVMKTSLLLSIALGIVIVVAVSVVWAVLNASGLWDSINSTVGEVVGTQSSQNFRIQDYVGTERVLGFTMLVAAVDVVLVTVVATLGAFLYNLAAALLGGLEVVLAEDEF